MSRKLKSVGGKQDAEPALTPRLRFPEFQDAEGWTEKPLGEVSDVLMCKRIFAEETNPNKGVPFFKIGTLGGVPDAFISGEKFEDYKSRYNFPRKSEVLITCSGTVGKCLPYDGKDAYFQDSNIVWIDNPTLEVSNEFLLMLLSDVNWGRLNSTTITRIYGPDLRGLAIRFPEDKHEQQKIASCLTTLDEVIAAQSQKLDALKTHKKGLMQQLFPREGETLPRLRFPEFHDGGDWEQKTIATVCKLKAGEFVSASAIADAFSDGLFPCYGGNGLRGYIQSFTHDGTFVLIGRQGALCGNVNLFHGKFHATEHALVVTPHDGFAANWLYYALGMLNLNRFAIGQAQPGLSVGVLNNVPLATPRDEVEQQRIASCLTSLDDLIAAQSAKLEALKTHKKALMQQLFPSPKAQNTI